MTSVLIVDDEPRILRALQMALRAHGYTVVTAADARSALEQAAASPVDVIVLDLGLPDMDGLQVIRRLRTWTQVPIVVLSARHGSRDKVATLDAGADDYVTKPFGLDELLARLRVVTRRESTPVKEHLITVDGFVVDLGRRRVLRDGQETRLTPTEWKILEVLVRNPEKLVSQQHLLATVWGPSYVKESNYLRVYMAQLRRKLEADPANPRHFLTEAGIGYRFQP